MDDDRVRSAIFEATAYGWGRSEMLDAAAGSAGFYRSDGRIVGALNAGKVLATLDRQRLAVRNWLYFAYGCEFRRSEYEAAVRALCDARVVVEHRAKRRRSFDTKITVTPEELPRYECLCRLALNNFRWRQYRLSALPDRAMEVALDVARGSFADYWRAKMARLENEVGRWDAEGVGNVAAVVDDIVHGRLRKKTLA
jgi:hypothetical protein